MTYRVYKYLAGVLLATFLSWDYAAHPDLLMVLIFVRGEGQSYDWDAPLVPVDVLSGGLVLSVPCLSLPLLTLGPWWAVVRAMGKGQMSDPSNEVRFYWTRQDGCLETAPLTPEKPTRPPLESPPVPPAAGAPPSLGEQFPPVVVRPPAAKPWPTATGGSLDHLTESCAWRGCQAPPAPPMKDPGPPLVELPLWRGQGR